MSQALTQLTFKTLIYSLQTPQVMFFKAVTALFAAQHISKSGADMQHRRQLTVLTLYQEFNTKSLPFSDIWTKAKLQTSRSAPSQRERTVCVMRTCVHLDSKLLLCGSFRRLLSNASSEAL